jgi:hypothetical protein
MPRTPTLPTDDATMWRRLLARTHPDGGGDHELFIWATAVKDTVCWSDGEVHRVEPYPRRPKSYNPPPTDAAERVAFSPFEDFDSLTEKVLSVAEEVVEVYGRLLRLLADCYTALDGPLYQQQKRGATYKQLAAIAHAVGMTKAERSGWYRLAESLPLSQRHAGHLLGKLQHRQGAA